MKYLTDHQKKELKELVEHLETTKNRFTKYFFKTDKQGEQCYCSLGSFFISSRGMGEFELQDMLDDIVLDEESLYSQIILDIIEFNDTSNSFGEVAKKIRNLYGKYFED